MCSQTAESTYRLSFSYIRKIEVETKGSVDYWNIPITIPPGAYTMPNMTNPEVLNLYAAAIDFLAARLQSSRR